MIDYLIIGFGLSGAALSSRLEAAGKSFMVLDDTSQNASRVAGGLINPVVLKRFTLAWNADAQMQKALGFYKELEERLQVEFLHPLEVYRRFSSVEEQNDWFAASDKPGLEKYLETSLKRDLNPFLKADHAFGKLRGTYRLQPLKMLESYSARLIDQGKMERSSFDHDALELMEQGIRYKGLTAKKVIFCEGYGLTKNSFFSYLPLRGNKGEYLYIHSPDLKLNAAVKSSIFVIPVGQDIYAVGATYNNQDKVEGPTEEAREELLKKLREFITADFKVVDQVAGFRPATVDRRPLVGQHPVHKQLYCCNGFGSRGILLAPSISEDLLLHIEEGKSLPADIDLGRFTRKWFPKA